VVSSWDRRSAAEQTTIAEAALRSQVTDRLARFSPYWRETVRGAGVRVADLHGLADLGRIPAVGERDLCPDGDPAGAARLVLQVDEADFASHAADGAGFRRALGQRFTSPGRYRRTVSAAVRPVTYHLGGLALPLPIASTRNDLDLVARAGARLWQVLGLGPADVLVSALPSADRLAGFALPYAALGAAAPAIQAGLHGAAQALDLLPATVLAVEDAAMLDALLDLRSDVLPDTVRTVLVTGDPVGVLDLAGDVRVLRVWGPAEARWLWAECAPGSGLHTYPDLEVLEVLDPATGDRAQEGELALTQLGTYGSALVRWRTGAVVSGLEVGDCRHCGRTVPRVAPDLVAGALLVAAEVAGRDELLDLRAVAGALAGRDDLDGWVVEVRHTRGVSRVVVRVAPAGPDAAVESYADIEAVAGCGPTQVVVDPGVRGLATIAR
jgi:hypothetical protein